MPLLGRNLSHREAREKKIICFFHIFSSLESDFSEIEHFQGI